MAAELNQAGLEALAQQLGERLLARGWMLATAESCTGGWVAQCLTAIAGSSAWFERGFVTYSNAAKMDMLGVAERLLEKHGAVSEPVARAMAQGAVAHSRAQWSLAITGIAGPTGGSAENRWAWCVLPGPARMAAAPPAPGTSTETAPASAARPWPSPWKGCCCNWKSSLGPEP